MPKLPSLQAQCEQIGWQLHIMHARYLGTKRWDNGKGNNLHPEEVVAGRMSEEGRQCSWCEGGSFNLLMKAAALDVLANRNIFNDRSDAVRRYFEAQCTILKDFEREIIDCIRNVARNRLTENIAEICADSFIQEAYPRVRYDFLLSLSCAVDADFLSQVASVFMKNPYGYRSGWPDLTIINAQGVSFVEVKTTDRLHESQLRFAGEVAKPLRLACSVIQLKPHS